MSRRKKKKAVKEEKEKKLSHYKEIGAMAFDMLKQSRRGFRVIRKNIAVTKLLLLVSVGGEDAHQTAELYGKYAAAIFPVLGLLGSLVKIRDPAIYLAPNFLSEKTVIEASVRVRVTPLAILIATLHIGVSVIRVLLNSKDKSKDKNKGGIKHERTSSRG